MDDNDPRLGIFPCANRMACRVLQSAWTRGKGRAPFRHYQPGTMFVGQACGMLGVACPTAFGSLPLKEARDQHGFLARACPPAPLRSAYLGAGGCCPSRRLPTLMCSGTKGAS